MTTLFEKKGSFPRGIHPPERKEISGSAPIEVLPTPKEVRIPVLQHLGAPCEVTVKPRAKVALGEVVGKATGFVSAPVHASVSGTVGRASVTTLPNGRHVTVVTVDADADQPLSGQALREDVLGGEWPVDGLGNLEPSQITAAASNAGLVGMGGAAFPTHVKITRNDKKPIRTLLVNGCECEPYLTSDYRLMLEAPKPVVAGALLAQRATGAEEVILCIEDNKRDAADVLAAAVSGTGVRVWVLRTRYPQGGEKQLTVAVLGKAVPTGGLPLDIGVLVMNVGTTAALARAVLRGKPLTHRIVSVTGGGIRTPRNLLVPIGTSLADLIGFCGGLTPDAARVIAGGPMMGFAVGSLDVPVTKGTSGITVLTRDDVRRGDETPCLRCGRCVDVCPLHLVPTKLGLGARTRNVGVLERYQVAACMECGCCAYACPARIPLVQLIRVGKVVQKEARSS